MGRVKMKKAVFTFPSTVQAMKMEQVCHSMGVTGRLIPVPGEISAGCGLAWVVPVEEKESIKKVVEEGSIEVEGVYEMML